jgi:uncharacterized protein (TIGR03435 family)
MTEIKGRYKINLHWVPDFDTVEAGEVRKDKGILSVLEAQLGLKLQPRKMPVDILVIDHVERTPTRN